jgi:hypothetical protein
MVSARGRIHSDFLARHTFWRLHRAMPCFGAIWCQEMAACVLAKIQDLQLVRSQQGVRLNGGLS